MIGLKIKENFCNYQNFDYFVRHGKKCYPHQPKFSISTKIILKHSRFWFYTSTSENWSTVKLITLITFQSFDNPTSTRLLSHTLPLYLQFYYLLCHFINFKLPPPPGSWVIHYHSSYIFYTLCFYFNLTYHFNLTTPVRV